MRTTPKTRLTLALLLCAAGSAHADYVGVLSGTPITAPASLGFHNDTGTNLTSVGTVAVAPYNFLDKWSFELSSLASVSSITAVINFLDGANAVLFGIDNLQVNLINDPAFGPSGLPIVSWATVSTPAPNVQQVIAFTSPALLAGGHFLLEVRGTIVGSAAYAGTLIANPPAVPAPATLPLLLMGLAALGVAAKRGASARR
jgi:hypothetical protein